MSIAVLCPKCQKKLAAPNMLAGKAVKCPHCDQAMRLPSPVREPQAVCAGMSSSKGSGALDALIPPDLTPMTGGLRLNGLFDEQRFDDLLADVGPRIDNSHKTEHNLYPCPICHEMIVRGARRCPSCDEDFQKHFKSSMPEKQKSSSGQSFHKSMSLLGGVWIAVSGLLLGFALVCLLAVGSDQPDAMKPLFLMRITALAGLCWMGLGIATFRKAIWAVWAGMILNYLGLLGSIAVTFYGLFTHFSIASMFLAAVTLAPQFLIIMLAHHCLQLGRQMRFGLV